MAPKFWLNDTRTDLISAQEIRFLVTPKYCTCMVVTGGVVSVNPYCEWHGDKALAAAPEREDACE